jgi:hypothetical protein
LIIEDVGILLCFSNCESQFHEAKTVGYMYTMYGEKHVNVRCQILKRDLDDNFGWVQPIELGKEG